MGRVEPCVHAQSPARHQPERGTRGEGNVAWLDPRGAARLHSGYATVHQEDLDAWAGRPVSDLEKHPILMTLPVVRTTATDGTEIRDYVNGKTISQCSSGGTVFAGYVSMATYSGFTNCMQNFAACQASSTSRTASSIMSRRSGLGARVATRMRVCGRPSLALQIQGR